MLRGFYYPGCSFTKHDFASRYFPGTQFQITVAVTQGLVRRVWVVRENLASSVVVANKVYSLTCETDNGSNDLKPKAIRIISEGSIAVLF